MVDVGQYKHHHAQHALRTGLRSGPVQIYEINATVSLARCQVRGLLSCEISVFILVTVARQLRDELNFFLVSKKSKNAILQNFYG